MTFDLAVDLANVIGVCLTLLTLVEVVRTKHWAKRKLDAAQERWAYTSVGSRIDSARRIIHRMQDDDRIRDEGRRMELRDVSAEMRNDPRLSMLDQRMIQRVIHGLHVSVDDVESERDRLRRLLDHLADLRSRITAKLAAEDVE